MIAEAATVSDYSVERNSVIIEELSRRFGLGAEAGDAVRCEAFVKEISEVLRFHVFHHRFHLGLLDDGNFNQWKLNVNPS